MAKILLIDDDPALQEILSGYLRHHDYDVEVAGTVEEAQEVTIRVSLDLVLLDIMMPGAEGWQYLRSGPRQPGVPVIVLSARSSEYDILQGFALGCDDYVTKPFSFAQLEARIRTRISHAGKAPGVASANLLVAGDIVVDIDSHRVTRKTQFVKLTPTEFSLLCKLMQHRGKVLSPEQLVSELWGPEYLGGGEYIRRYVWHLRQKLEEDPSHPVYIHNERNLGYYFTED